MSPSQFVPLPLRAMGSGCRIALGTNGPRSARESLPEQARMFSFALISGRLDAPQPKFESGSTCVQPNAPANTKDVI